MTEALRTINEPLLSKLLPFPAAVDALEAVLADGVPQGNPPRSIIDLANGQLLLMPATSNAYTGVKIITVNPSNARRGLPRIQGNYLLCDGETLTPRALIDGIALTSLRTPAVSAIAVRRLARPDASRLVVFGTGPQAWGHVEAFAAERPITRVGVVSRDPATRAAFVARCRDAGFEGYDATPAAVADADLIACCTTAREPLFDGALVRDGAVVVAVGSHEAEAREVDDTLVMRSLVVVEDRETALRESGDIVIPVNAGVVDASIISADLGELVAGLKADGRPVFFKSSGMAWEDLAIAAAAYKQLSAT